jgi:hypothetical protein
MDDLILLAEFRSDTPGPTAAEAAAARDKLLAAMADSQPSSARTTRITHRSGRGAGRFWLPVAAMACVAAVGIAAAVLIAPGQRATQPERKQAVLTAAVVLRKAASAAASQATGNGQFFVSESEYIDPANGQDAPAIRIIWIGDSVTGRVIQGGHGPAAIPPGISFGRRTITWAQLRSLPTTPGPLLAVIAAASRDNGQPLVQAEFSNIVGLLFEAPTPPALRSALYLAAAQLPGVTLVPGAHDLIGRAAAEVYVPPGFSGDDGEALYFDPSTSAVLGIAALAGSQVQCPPSSAYAVLATGYVRSMHQLPAGAPRGPERVTWHHSVPGCPGPSSGQPSVSPSSG